MTLFLVLFAFDRPTSYLRWENWAFACVYGVCGILILGIGFEFLWDREFVRDFSTWLPPADTVYPSTEGLVGEPKAKGEAVKEVRAAYPFRPFNLEQFTLFVSWTCLTVLAFIIRRSNVK